MAEILKYADKLFPLIIGGVICIGVAIGAIYLLIKFVEEAKSLPSPTEIIENIPAYTIEKAKYEWSKEYLENKEKEKQKPKDE